MIEAIQYKGCPCIELEDLWNTLHNFFNSTQMREVDLHVLDNIPDKSTSAWDPFSKQELVNTIEKCNNLSAPGPNKLIWSHIKFIIRSEEYIFKLVDIANTCINLGYWLSYFKSSTMVVIPKPNKTIFNSPKSY